MAKIRITNKKTAFKKLKRYLNLGLITGAVLGTTWALPRAINQYNLDSKLGEAYETISEENYFEVHDPSSILEGFTNQEYLFPEQAQHKIEGLEGRIRVKREKIAISEIEGMIYRRQYFDAKATLGGFKLMNILDEEALFKMSQSVSQIHPAVLEKQADNIPEGGFAQLELYIAAKREFGLLDREEREGLSDKIVGAHLETIEEGYENQNNNLGPSINIKRLTNYLESNSIDTSIESERAGEFFAKSGEFMDRMLSGNKTPTTIKLYLDRTNDLATMLKMENAEQGVRTLAMKFVDHLMHRGENKRFHIAHATSLNDNYGLGREEEIVGAYLQTYDEAENKAISQKLLSDALVYAEALPEETQNRIKTEVADRYFEFAQNWEDKGEAYLLFQTVRGIYGDAGVGLDDDRFLRLNEAVENKLGGRNEMGIVEREKIESGEDSVSSLKEDVKRLESVVLTQKKLLLKTLTEKVE